MTVPETKIRTSRKKIATASALSTVGLVVMTGVAWGAVTDNMIPTSETAAPCQESSEGTADNMPCQTDNSAVYYYMDSKGAYELEQPDRDVVKDVLSDEYSPTDLAIHYDSSPVFEGDGETDIIYQEGSTDMPGNLDGMTWCNATGGDTFDCDQQYIRIRGNGTYTPGLTCHETGHAVGLLHGSDAVPELSNDNNDLGCMQTPVGYGESLGSNNREHIDSVY